MKECYWKNNRFGFSALAILPVVVIILIAVFASHTEGVRAAAYVYENGSISGTVTDEAGQPLENVHVYAVGGYSGWAASTSTDAAGNYTLSGLATGNYIVSFFPQDGIHLSEYYDNKSEYNLADPVAVTAGNATTGINASLATGGSISGTVTDEFGQPLPNIEVWFYKLDGNGNWDGYPYLAYTDANGTYLRGSLPSGNYKVGFSPVNCAYPWCASGGNFLQEFYNDKPDMSTADLVVVTVGSTIENIDASLAAGGSISGTVTSETGTPLQGINITVYQLDTEPWGSYWSVMRSAVTDANGNYSVGGLASGDYKVGFGSQDYLPEYYDNKSEYNLADPVAVTAGNATTGINASLATGGSISGTVTDEFGQPLQNVEVTVYEFKPNYWSFAATAYTDASGHYSVGRLGTGDYKVGFNSRSCYQGCAGLPEFYNDTPDLLSSDLVPVTLGGATENIDATLATGGSISGTVTDDSGQPLQGVYVHAFKVNEVGNAIGCYQIVSTDANGNYSIVGLDSGNYKVIFYGFGNYIGEYYNDKPNEAAADLVPVTAGSDTSNIDASLAAGGQISGHVTDETGQSLQGAWVEAYKYDSASGDWSWAGGDDTDVSGNYTISGLTAGDYKVRFISQSYAPEYYNDKPDLDSADTIALPASGSVTNIDASLAAGSASITGNVTDESGQPIQGVEVNIYELGGMWIDSASTDVNGDYSLDGLATADYKIWFNTSFCYIGCANLDYAPEYYSDKSDLASADPVSAAAGTVTAGIDASLATGGSITGTVTNEAGQALQNVLVDLYQLNNTTGEWYPGVVNFTLTDDLGNYSLTGLATGDYKVQFADSRYSTYLAEYFNDKNDLNSADLISVTTGAATENIDAVLACADNDAPNVTIDSPAGTVLSDSPTIAADYNDGTGTGLDISTVSVLLDGNDVTGSCNVGISSVSCSTSSLGQGSHTVSVSVSDHVGNTGSDSSTFTVNTKPALTLSLTKVYWNSYSDYQAGLLSIDFVIGNKLNSANAMGVQIVGIVNTNGVTVASPLFPYSLGTINAGSSVAFTVQYVVKDGVGSFRTILYATADGGFAYPGPYTG